MSESVLVWYIAGPMSGLPQFNIPMFDRVAAELREAGWMIVSPAELDSPLMRKLALASEDGDAAMMTEQAGETWGDVLARDVKVISDQVGGIILLPGWAGSRGARLEAFVGTLTGKAFLEYQQNGALVPMGYGEVLDGVRGDYEDA